MIAIDLRIYIPIVAFHLCTLCNSSVFAIASLLGNLCVEFPILNLLSCTLLQFHRLGSLSWLRGYRSFADIASKYSTNIRANCYKLFKCEELLKTHLHPCLEYRDPHHCLVNTHKRYCTITIVRPLLCWRWSRYFNYTRHLNTLYCDWRLKHPPWCGY